LDANLTPEQKKLNGYSVADYHERSIFRQVRALARKKITIMQRDRKSFFMDILLPNLLIVIGLYMTTVDFIGDAHYPIRSLTIEDFPGNQPLIYNQRNFNQTDDEV
jgi:hypothetical protein